MLHKNKAKKTIIKVRTLNLYIFDNILKLNSNDHKFFLNSHFFILGLLAVTVMPMVYRNLSAVR
jgi:hypothetical protein